MLNVYHTGLDFCWMYIIQGLIFSGCILYKVLFLLDVYHTRFYFCWMYINYTRFDFFLDVYHKGFDFCWTYIMQGLIFAGCILYKV